MAINNETVKSVIEEMRCANVLYGANDSSRPMTRFEKALIKLYADRFEAAYKREVAELRECLKDAVREVCPHIECGNNICFRLQSNRRDECIVNKWRKALEGANDDNASRKDH